MSDALILVDFVVDRTRMLSLEMYLWEWFVDLLWLPCSKCEVCIFTLSEHVRKATQKLENGMVWGT